MSLRVGIDIGGTFTDLVIADPELQTVRIEKVPTTPGRLWAGVAAAIDQARVPLAETASIAHGTTVALNALLERRGAATGLITTAGFRDVYEIARHNRVDTYDLFYRKPVPLVPRRYRLGVQERVAYDGSIKVPLVEQDVLEAAEYFAKHGIAAVAVCLLHAYRNPAHEVRVGELLAEALPEVSISLSHELARQWREYERTSTTAINAYVMPVVGSYLDEMQASLEARDFHDPLLVSQSAGGVIGIDVARQRPVRTIMSGPAGGATAALHFSRSFGKSNVIAFDVGGTSADVSLVLGSKLRVTVEAEVDRHPIVVPMIEIKSIGAGGGSIASVDEHGKLDVGPASAGADPGPICYGRGGTRATVTDAFAVLGCLDPQRFLGGQMALDVGAARRGIDQEVAQRLGLTVAEAARGIIEIVDTKMAYAVRAVTIERGLDPREFTLLAYGGAGPLSACSVAARIGIREIIVPISPGNFSALGMVVSDVRHDFVRTMLLSTNDSEVLSTLARELVDLSAEANTALAGEGVAADRIRLEPAIDVRYEGQEYTLTVSLPTTDIDETAFDAAVASFHAEHEQRYGHSAVQGPTEVVGVRLVALGPASPLALATAPAGDAEPSAASRVGEVEMILGDGTPVLAPVYERTALAPGNRVAAPAVVVEKGATTLLLDPFDLEVTRHGHLRLEAL